ncbi:MAG: hypothetical protein V4508_01685 [Pseudomonadota bacterium]
MNSSSIAALRLGALGLALSQAFSPSAWAATEAERIAVLEKQIQANNALIAQLAARLNQLEHAPAAAPAATPDAAAQASRIDAIEQTVSQIVDAENNSKTANNGVPLHGFSDVRYAYSGKPVADGRKKGMALGNLDLYLTPDLGGRVKSLLELNFEYGDAGTLGTDLERLQLGYTFSDALTVWAGRFHTPYGYWNTAFHHGAQIQTSVDRPRMIDFEDGGGILPAHTVGIWGTGQVRLGNGKLAYDAYLGNGGRVLDGILDFNAVKDDNGNSMVGASVRYHFGGAADGLVLGAHAFNEDVSAYSGALRASSTRIRMAGAYAYYDANDWEVISEYYHFRNRALEPNGATRASWSGFLQVGKLLDSGFTPYVRWEKAALDQQDAYFAALDSGRSYVRQAIGVRYDLTPKMALKLQLSHSDDSQDGGAKYREAQLQAAIRF